MTTKISIRNLQIITALDSLSYGLIYPFISPYVVSLGGSHLIVGLLSIGILLGELVSQDVSKMFTHLHGKRYSLFFILNTAMVTHLMIILTKSYWFTILVRILFSITNQSQNLCYEILLSKAQNDKDCEKLRSNYSVLSGFGYILGPIISGYLFDHGFIYIALLAAFLTLINTTLLMKVGKSSNDINPEHTSKSVLEKACDKIKENINYFKKSGYQKHWDILLIKYLFAASVMIFFSKFTQLLRYNYYSANVTVGYTTSYINILVFAATYYVAIVKSTSDRYPIVFLSEISFILMCFLLIFACYAPFYEVFMILLVPIIFLRAFITNMWKELFLERKDEFLNKLNNSISVLAGVTIPIFFGVTCDQIAQNAVIIFSCFPVFLCWIITKWYSKFVQIEDEKDK